MPGPVRKYPYAHKAFSKPGRLDKWLRGWLLGQQGLSGAATDLAHSVDPRTRQGALGLASMLVPGKPSAENALAAHLGHSQFRPYRATGEKTEEGLYTMSDPIAWGGATPHKEGADFGYPAALAGGSFRKLHGYSLMELMGLVPSKRIADKNLLYKTPGGLLHWPYRTNRGLNN